MSLSTKLLRRGKVKSIYVICELLKTFLKKLFRKVQKVGDKYICIYEGNS